MNYGITLKPSVIIFNFMLAYLSKVSSTLFNSQGLDPPVVGFSSNFQQKNRLIMSISSTTSKPAKCTMAGFESEFHDRNVKVLTTRSSAHNCYRKLFFTESSNLLALCQTELNIHISVFKPLLQ